MLCPGRGLPVLTTTGSGSLGAASSESDAGSVLFRHPGMRLFSWPRIRFRSSRGRAVVRVSWWVWMVVRFFM